MRVGTVDPHKITPVILAGGRGTRLRPLTADHRPKPFLKLLSLESIFQETIRRVSNLGAPMIVCDQAFSEKIQAEMGGVGAVAQNIIGEPMGRSTGPAVALAAFLLKDTDNLMMVMPSDHYMRGVDLTYGLQAWREESGFLIYGAVPQKPSRRYGYMQADAEGRLQRFIEKPDRYKARALYSQGGVFWNTGIFLTRPAHFLSCLKVQVPAVYEACEAAVRKGRRNGERFYPDSDSYKRAPSIAVDYAVMEHITDARVVPIGGIWHDVGCWPDLVNVLIKRLIMNIVR